MNRQHVVAQVLLRAWPFPRGAGRITDKFFSTLRFTQERVTVSTTDGFPITVMPNELIGRHLYLTGEFDRTTVEVLINFSEAGDVLLDIGANVGYVSGCFLTNVVCSTTICVEPQPRVLELLRANMREFSEDRYLIAPIALSDRDEEGWLEICHRNLGESKLVRKSNPNTTRVSVQSADRFFSSLKLDRLDLVKIDVEGHEANVFNASRSHFQRLQPRAIFFEDHLQNSAPDGCIGSLLREIGYDVFSVKKFLTKIALIPTTRKSDCSHNDYIAVSRTRHIPRAALSKYNIVVGN